MEFIFKHTNLNVTDLDKSIAFYERALGLALERRVKAPDGSFELAFVSDGKSGAQLELTWLRDHPQPYDLADNEIHTAFAVADVKVALEEHRALGCVCYENTAMGIYFIEDPDGYWAEIIPSR
ncbi:MAG: VOC family protein [Oscillospiraceae bacterium]|jgi:lactoylglutathione lyase|nr:VOC family protein [Oscillospiraceae bacterium]